MSKPRKDLRSVSKTQERNKNATKENYLCNKGTERGFSILRPIGLREFKRCINLCSLTSKILGLKKVKHRKCHQNQIYFAMSGH